MIVYQNINEYRFNVLTDDELNEAFKIKPFAQKATMIAGMILSLLNARDIHVNKETIERSPLVTSLAKKDTISKLDVYDVFKQFIDKNDNKLVNKFILKNTDSLKISDEGIDLIKKHEKLRLKAYSIGDKRITIGYGHAERDSVSTYQIGDSITVEEANRLLELDIKKAENGLHRMFNEWKKEGRNVKVSQHMWDSMVSMAFNMGVKGFNTSDIAELLKNHKYVQAADTILNTKVKYPGLKGRRQEERELFIKNLFI